MLSGVSAAVQMIMVGMPGPADLRATVHDGWTVVGVGRVAVAGYRSDDGGMRNMVAVTLTGLGFTGRRVAEVLGLTPEYVSELRGQARREGSAGLTRRPGRPAKLSDAQVRQAVQLRAQGLSATEIGRRLGVSDKTAAKAFGYAGVLGDTAMEQAEFDLGSAPDTSAAPVPTGEPATAAPAAGRAGEAAGAGHGSARIDTGVFACRYAGSMLLYGFTHQVGADAVFAGAAGMATPRGGRRFDDVAILGATSMVFSLGFASLEQAKHPDRAQVGPVAGIDVLPELRTLRPRLAAIADACDPLGLQRSLAAAMLRVEPNLSGVYFVDEHFMPYTGALPVGSGWNTKRRHAEPGRVDTTICDPKGRAVCFTSGEPSGLATSLPTTLDQLQQILGTDAPIMLGFDRGGAYPAVFRACRQRGAHWITYRRAPLAAPTRLPIHTTITHPRRTPATVAYADETIDIKDYGQARQITLFEHGRPVLQILTSEATTCPGALILFMRARWRIENLFKYLDFYGIDYLADYHATVSLDTRKIDNPARKKLRTQLKELLADRDRLRERIGALHTDRDITIPELNRQSTTAQQRIHTLDKQIGELQQRLKTVPAKLPANVIDPDASRAVHMVLRLLAANAENWLAYHLNAYLQDDDEYRATTRNLLHFGGRITYTDTTVHIELDRPNTPRLAHALALLLEEINQTPAHIPGDPRPLTYTLKP